MLDTWLIHKQLEASACVSVDCTRLLALDKRPEEGVLEPVPAGGMVRCEGDPSAAGGFDPSVLTSPYGASGTLGHSPPNCGEADVSPSGQD